MSSEEQRYTEEAVVKELEEARNTKKWAHEIE